MSTSPTADKAKLRRPRLPGYLHVSDIQGLAQLATQGTLGVAGPLAWLHHEIVNSIGSIEFIVLPATSMRSERAGWRGSVFIR